ncbi:MAG: tetratricopeptide repeat protein [Brevinema sp.]
MKLLILFMTLFCFNNISYTMIVKDPNLKLPAETTVTNYHENVPPYNPYSLFVPSSEFLKQLPSDRVLDMGAAAYGTSFYTKALYFYTNAIELFSDNRVQALANYETAYIYFRKKKNDKAVEYFEKVIGTPGVNVALESLSKMMINRILNETAYKIYMKQEDLLFLEEKKAQKVLNTQIAKEERVAAARRRQLSKDRKAREKAERDALKAEEKAKKAAEKEAAKVTG